MKKTFKLALAALALASSTALNAMKVFGFSGGSAVRVKSDHCRNLNSNDAEITKTQKDLPDDQRIPYLLDSQAPLLEVLAEQLTHRAAVINQFAADLRKNLPIPRTLLRNIDAAIIQTLKDLGIADKIVKNEIAPTFVLMPQEEVIFGRIDFVDYRDPQNEPS